MTTNSKLLNADDATVVVFMLEELAVAEGEGLDPPGNDITSF